MSEFFLNIVNMSISASWIVLAVLLLRLLLRKAPKWIAVLLWGIVAVRLICPLTIESVMSLIPSAETVSPDIMMDSTPAINSGITPVNNIVNPIISEAFAPQAEAEANPLEIWIPILAVIWLIGMAGMLLYTLISYFRVKRKIGTAVLLCDNIYQSESVISPFVLGIVKPRIYLPFNMNGQDMSHVIAHEQAHIHRKDHLWKPFGFLLLTIHWFNPFIWLGYVLLCRDIELACDEKVVKDMDSGQKADYSQALLKCSVNRRMIAACPLAFGEVGVKSRVKSVLNYKKPAFWIIVVAIVVSIAAAVCFLTDPLSKDDGADDGTVFTEFDGVYTTLESFEADEVGQYLFKIVWHNETDKEVTYGDMFSIERNTDGEWTDAADGEVYFNTIGYILKPNETEEKQYITEHYDLTKAGKYRLSLPFSVETDGERKQYKTWVEFEIGSQSYVGGVDGPQSVVVLPDMEQLKAKFPNYFNLTTSKGLEVYIWQMAEDSYSCGLLPGKNRNYTNEELWDLHTSSASLDEMRAIIADYMVNGDVNQSDIVIRAVTMPHSSYSYTIDDEYQRKLKELFWSEIPIVENTKYSAVIDTAAFDIDGDGTIEQCSLSHGPTSGLFTFVLSVWENGRLEYFNIYNGSAGEMSFETTIDTTMLRLVPQGDSKPIYYFFSVKDGNIVLTSDGEAVAYWGEQGVNSTYAPKTASNLDTAIAKVLNEKYRADRPDGLIHIENYYLLANETASGTPLYANSGHMQKATVYLLVYYMKYSVNGGQLSEADGGFVPTAITFSIDKYGKYTLEEYWTPEAGVNYNRDVYNKFPGGTAKEALNTDKYAEGLIYESRRAANEELSKIKSTSK